MQFNRIQKKPRQPAKNYACWLLGRKEYSVSQMRDKLLSRGYEESEVSDALEWLQSHRFLDDSRVAQSIVKNSTKLGSFRINQKLKQADIGEELAQEALEDCSISEIDKAIDALGTKANKLNWQEPKEVAKIWRYLSYRGFGVDTIKQVLSKLKDSSTSN